MKAEPEFAQPKNVVNGMVKEGLPEEKLQEKLNKYHRPENCELHVLTKVQVNQSMSMGSSYSSRSIPRC